jgi:hypothetical protein
MEPLGAKWVWINIFVCSKRRVEQIRGVGGGGLVEGGGQGGIYFYFLRGPQKWLIHRGQQHLIRGKSDWKPKFNNNGLRHCAPCY